MQALDQCSTQYIVNCVNHMEEIKSQVVTWPRRAEANQGAQIVQPRYFPIRDQRAYDAARPKMQRNANQQPMNGRERPNDQKWAGLMEPCRLLLGLSAT